MNANKLSLYLWKTTALNIGMKKYNFKENSGKYIIENNYI